MSITSRRILEYLNNGDIERVLEVDNLHDQLNYLVENNFIVINDQEITITEKGLDIL
ncbi:hypothetical protein SAMN04488034_103103 [Salinimicrobium catena]|uniref:Uncharacterized protein n=1 Tax=Salinimicrobium catena TaxID=390640 RepID=A0A1H5MTN9_9FLAO|nr:hypothetical protein SAMN04488140_103103 [Salinimicrobium catena]SEE92729.1 hypothetical protein SAMN04488034_103103 [Salinimicrobium catena]